MQFGWTTTGTVRLMRSIMRGGVMQGLMRGGILLDQGGGASPPAAQYWNPAKTGSPVTLHNGNRDAGALQAGAGFATSATGRATGKHYAEFVLGFTNDSIGVCNSLADWETSYLGDVNSAGWWISDGGLLLNDVATDYGPPMPPGTVMGLAVDLDARRLYVSAGGAYRNSGNPVTGANNFSIAALTGTLFLAGCPSDPTNRLRLRTALADFTYAPPAGYSAWG